VYKGLIIQPFIFDDMAFIHKHNSSGKTFTFYTDEITSKEKNIFTVLVGKNGCGKIDM